MHSGSDCTFRSRDLPVSGLPSWYKIPSQIRADGLHGMYEQRGLFDRVEDVRQHWGLVVCPDPMDRFPLWAQPRQTQPCLSGGFFFFFFFFSLSPLLNHDSKQYQATQHPKTRHHSIVHSLQLFLVKTWKELTRFRHLRQQPSKVVLLTITPTINHRHGP